MQDLLRHLRLEPCGRAPYQARMGLRLHIRDLRKARNLTLSDLAARVGVSTPHMSEVERGLKNLNNHLLTRIAAALDVRPEDLISGEDRLDLSLLLDAVRQLPPEDQDRVTDFARALLASRQVGARKE